MPHGTQRPPENHGSYSSQRLTLEWAIALVQFYRPLGFFAKAGAQSDAELAEELLGEQGHVGHPQSPEQTLDPPVIANDKDRVWWQDAEADVFEGNNAYVEAFAEWGLISRGTFDPKNVDEQWLDGEEDDPMSVSFDFGGKRHRLQGTNYGDYYDLGFLGKINRLIAPTGIQYCSWNTGDQTAFVVCLKEAERVALGSYRNFLFNPILPDDEA